LWSLAFVFDADFVNVYADGVFCIDVDDAGIVAIIVVISISVSFCDVNTCFAIDAVAFDAADNLLDGCANATNATGSAPSFLHEN
jgi:hypothetical protein